MLVALLLCALCSASPRVACAQHPDPPPGFKNDSVTVVPGLFSEGPVWINFTLRETGLVRFEVYDVRGVLARVVASGYTFSAGSLNGVLWDGRDDWGAPLRSGVYFVRMGRFVGENERRRTFQQLAKCVIVCRK